MTKTINKGAYINSDDYFKICFCQPSILFLLYFFIFLYYCFLKEKQDCLVTVPLATFGSYTVGFVSGNHHLETPKPALDSL